MKTCKIEGCDGKHYGHGLCHKHYQRKDPLKITQQDKTPEERLLERIGAADPKTGCMEWTGARAWFGHGLINVDGVMIRVHRMIYEMKHGPIPDGMCVLHECDNPPCCNVDHLHLGTHQDNANEKVARGRCSPVIGEDHPSSKLTESQVIEIRCRLAEGETQQSIANLFGVNQQTISKIKNKKRWRHIK